MAIDAELHPEKLGHNVVIMGGGLVGSEAAVSFSHEGHECTIVEMKHEIAEEVNSFYRGGLLPEVSAAASICTDTIIREITADGVIVDKDGAESLITADSVVCALGFRSPYTQVDELCEAADESYIVGDCAKVGKIYEAMSVESKKIVEIARALSTDPDVLILDEVTQALAQDNRTKLHNLIQKYKEMGKSVILITHDLDEMIEITDSISILRDGELIETVDSRNITEDELKTKMVGRNLEGEYYRSDTEATRGEQKILSVSDLTTVSGLNSVSFDLYSGEILGLCGLSDSGIHAGCQHYLCSVYRYGQA